MSSSSFKSSDYWESSSSSSSEDNFLQNYREVSNKLFHELISMAVEQGSSSTQRHRGRDMNRDREAAQERLYQDYFAENCNYNDDMFRRRFRMSRRLFLRIVEDLEHEYTYFKQGIDARGRLGLSPLQKCTSAIRQLAYGVSADGFDEYLKLADSTARECFQNFTKGIINLYGKRYLRKPTHDDIQRLYAAHESRHGFPGMLGSIDCMHWDWDNCPVAWRGQYMRGDHDRPTIMLEAVASQDLWVWHAFFGVAGSNNDLNVLNQSPLFNDVYNGTAPQCPFQVNGSQYRRGYYLADGIYPDWATFVKSYTNPTGQDRIKFKAAQEAARKDVERCFGVLKARWHIIQNPARMWHPDKIRRVMYTCIILHNMILEDEGNAICRFDENTNQGDEQPVEVTPDEYQANFREVRNEETHHNLRADLIQHIAQLPIPEDN